MGGHGSHGHRTYPNAKLTTDRYHVLNICEWVRRGLLDNSEPFNFDWLVNDKVVATSRVKIDGCYLYVTPIYHVGDSVFDPEPQRIELWYHPVNFGGHRTFLLCPGCQQRRTQLFGAHKFICRECLQLVYRSRRQNVNDLDYCRHAKACAKLGWEPYGHIDGKKPRHMHQDTFKRLKAACIETAERRHANFLKECSKAFPIQGDSKPHT